MPPAPKPVEVQRLQGNPSHRPMRQPTLLGGRISEQDLESLRPPVGLSPGERRAWHEIITPLVAGGILDRADLTIVEMAAQALARSRQARRVLTREGITHRNSQGYCAHPAIAIEKGAMAEYRQLALQLGIGPSGRTRIGKASGATPEGGMAGEMRRKLPAPARLSVLRGGEDAD